MQGVLGASTDGSRVYFVAKKELVPGATAGENNLYLWTQGAGFKFIATGNTSNVFKSNWERVITGGGAIYISSRVTPDGMHLAFQPNNSLTGFPDNEKSEAYLYSAASGALACASCVVAEPENGAFIDGGNSDLKVVRPSRNLSDDGAHLFFYTEEALVPRDSNGLNDVYEYDTASGQVALISPGNGDCGYCIGLKRLLRRRERERQRRVLLVAREAGPGRPGRNPQGLRRAGGRWPRLPAPLVGPALHGRCLPRRNEHAQPAGRRLGRLRRQGQPVPEAELQQAGPRSEEAQQARQAAAQERQAGEGTASPRSPRSAARRPTASRSAPGTRARAPRSVGSATGGRANDRAPSR